MKVASINWGLAVGLGTDHLKIAKLKIADFTTFKLHKSGWAVLRDKETTKGILTLPKGTQSEKGNTQWVQMNYFVDNKSGNCRTNLTILALLTTAQKCCLLNSYCSVCRLTSYAPHVLIVVALWCMCFYEVISHILIVLTEGAPVVNTVTPCKSNMLCPFLIREICSILHFKVHKVCTS